MYAFPCNQFGAQEPKSEPEIREFVDKFDVEFSMFGKVDVLDGATISPVFAYLKACFPGEIAWNVRFLKLSIF